MKHVIVGTAGHIDHGKTELVRALTGVDCDRLEEEKRRGITIDIGFAPLTIGGDVAVGFIDVPGHERFVKNMLAGATGIDLVVLVVAADESIKPQTREHFDICRLLGVEGGLVALTKADLADAEMLEIVQLEVRDLVKGSFLDGAPILPVSARTGRGIPELLAALRARALEARPRSAAAFFRLPVDRAFSIKGFGAVVTGTLVAGEVADGDEAAVYPAGTRARIRGVQVHGRAVPKASAGQRTAVNLQGVDAAGLVRGQVLAPPGCLRPSSLLDVELTVLPGAPAPLKDLARVRFHVGTSEVLARVKLLGAAAVAPAETAFAQLRLETPGLGLPGDRFVMRQYSPMVTIGGGRILDAHPEKHRGEAAPARAALERLAAGGPDDLCLHALASAPAGLAASEMVVRTGRAPEEAARIRDRLVRGGLAVPAGDGAGTLLHRDWYERHRGRTLEVLTEFHRANPLMIGLPREELREKVLPGAPPEVARLVLERLAAEGRIRLEREFAALASHRLSLSPEDQALSERIEASFRRGELNPATLEEIVEADRLDAARAQRIYHLLLSRGSLVRIRDGKVFHAESLERLKARLWELRATRPVIDVASFKELTGTSRKNAIPLLEHLDAERVTRRRGNDREILPPPGPGA
jgi:selenocysteine-specific elongation factor